MEQNLILLNLHLETNLIVTIYPNFRMIGYILTKLWPVKDFEFCCSPAPRKIVEIKLLNFTDLTLTVISGNVWCIIVHIWFSPKLAGGLHVKRNVGSQLRRMVRIAKICYSHNSQDKR